MSLSMWRPRSKRGFVEPSSNEAIRGSDRRSEAGRMTAIAIDNIGQLVTADSAAGADALGVLSDVAVVIEADRIAAIEPAGAIDADDVIDARGRAVIPGFVDSHTHLVFAGDRAH